MAQNFLENILKVFKGQPDQRNTYASNTVIVHQFPRGLRAPSISPFCLKLETWLRMNNIPYIVCILSDIYNSIRFLIGFILNYLPKKRMILP